jgi:hypothetical protein
MRLRSAAKNDRVFDVMGLQAPSGSTSLHLMASGTGLVECPFDQHVRNYRFRRLMNGARPQQLGIGSRSPQRGARGFCVRRRKPANHGAAARGQNACAPIHHMQIEAPVAATHSLMHVVDGERCRESSLKKHIRRHSDSLNFV